MMVAFSGSLGQSKFPYKTKNWTCSNWLTFEKTIVQWDFDAGDLTSIYCRISRWIWPKVKTSDKVWHFRLLRFLHKICVFRRLWKPEWQKSRDAKIKKSVIFLYSLQFFEKVWWSFGCSTKSKQLKILEKVFMNQQFFFQLRFSDVGTPNH